MTKKLILGDLKLVICVNQFLFGRTNVRLPCYAETSLQNSVESEPGYRKVSIWDRQIKTNFEASRLPEQQQPLTLCKKANLLPLSKSWLQFGFTLSKTNRKSPKKLQNMEVGEEGAIFSLFLREKIVQRAGHPKVWCCYCCCCCCTVIPLQWTDANKNHLFSFYEAGKNVGSCEMLFLNNGPFLASFSSFLSLPCQRFAVTKGLQM